MARERERRGVREKDDGVGEGEKWKGFVNRHTVTMEHIHTCTSITSGLHVQCTIPRYKITHSLTHKPGIHVPWILR